jgi:hypothetical protein
MNGETPLSDERLEALVKARLEERAREIDPQPLLDRLQDRFSNSAAMEEPSGAAAVQPATSDTLARTRRTKQHSPARWRRWSVVVVAAASLALTVLGTIYLWPTPATAATLVLATKQVHELPVDRCYLIEVQRTDPGDSLSESTPPRVDRLWTRGDRFFIESSNRQYRWAWGQDDTGAVWLTSGRKRGLRLEAAEVPPGLSRICDTHSMQFDRLLSQLLQDFELTWESPDATTLPQTRVVHAVRKPGRSRGSVQEARLEIDAETKVIRRLIVKRWSRTWSTGWRLDTATYTLVGSEAQPDLCYQPEGHLEAPFVIYSREHEPEKRNAILTRLYGPWILQGWSASRQEAK